MILLDEEMRRVLQFGSWKAEWWIEQANRRVNSSPRLAEGLQAYAAEQAAIETNLADSFRRIWWKARQGAIPFIIKAFGPDSMDFTPDDADHLVPGPDAIEIDLGVDEDQDAEQDVDLGSDYEE